MSDWKQISAQEVEAAVADLRRQLSESGRGETVQRVDCSDDDPAQGLARLVLSLVELIRQLLERQAIRRMQGGSLNDDQIEQMGRALMQLEVKVREIASQFGLSPADLNLELGPLGNLLPK